jgi:hypothetical protein
VSADTAQPPDELRIELPHAGGCIFILDDACMAWLMNALSQAPALTSEQLQRARRRLAQR